MKLIVDREQKKLLGKKWYIQTNKSGNSYAFRMEGNRKIYLHRLIMGAQQGEFVDHKNGNGLDCRLSNMRICTRAENNANSSPRKDNKSGYRGIGWSSHADLWRLRLKNKHYGYFKTIEEAIKKYNQLAEEMYGEFAKVQ